MKEQIHLLGEEVAPVLREIYDSHRAADVPDAPTHASLVAARDAALAKAEHGPWQDAYRFETGDNWTGLRAEDRAED
ncbi:MAG: hypothetical protein Q4D73_01620 [Actinomycetaceae bacterium]|nr:hypothetical protein [Actinomycetaceae bacterium]